MNRLLQGDVASGKTVVAIYAMLVAVVGGCQAALMAPTEVLARQHFESLSRLLAQAKVRVALLAGSLTAAQRRDALAAIERGDVDLVVGTQAMIHAEIDFPRIGLVVIDEQHKFGVRQRARLRGDGPQPHYLVMTATPIPRTVGMIAYGDLDISVLRDHPPGRQSIHTYVGDEQQRDKWWDFFRRKLREGRQGYVIAPVVETDEESSLTSLASSFEALCNGELEAFRVDLIHGGMAASQKQKAMDDFRRGKTQVLVATSVIEVGVDVPNASVMTIENAERFGLAQLHQLRGRVGRGTHPGYVCVFSGSSSGEFRERLGAFESTTDGFRLAELDFEIRGPGDVLGTRQHGLPPLRVADVLRDQAELLAARDAARRLISADPQLQDASFAKLRRQVLARYEEVLELGDAG
jgi:ATP-dependent DNA helicase RecG